MPSKNCVDDFQKFVLSHRSQLESSGLPPHFWPTLHWKLQESIFDAVDAFQIVQVQDESSDGEAVEERDADEKMEEDNPPRKEAGPHSWKVLVTREGGLQHTDSEHVYLVDHAWTCRPQQARQQLRDIPRLLHRMALLMDLDVTQDPDSLVDAVFANMWRYNQTYSVSGPLTSTEDSVPIWYIMDEFGSRIQHCSQSPTFRCVPFYYMAQRESYSVLYPVKDVACGEEATRNYAEGPPCDALTQAALLLPWEPCDLTHVDCNQKEPSEEFLRSGRKEESLPDMAVAFGPVPTDRKLKVFSEYRYVNEHLTHPSFELTADEGEADIFWYNYHFKSYGELSREGGWKRVNQFPFEHVLTVKDLLALVCRRDTQGGPTVDPTTLSTLPAWLPTTYNLKTELPQFVSYFQQRQNRGLDNHWICKPWNLARSLDTHVTDNLHYILRLPSTGPKVACKYITDPVLFPRRDIGLVKFDFRYVVLLSSVQPLRLFAYRNFWLRFANKLFSLSDLDDYEKHFTVMNYTEAGPQQITCAEFTEQFDGAYPSHPWATIQTEVFRVLRRVFELATSRPPPSGLCPSPQSRAMYAADLMLEWDRSDPAAPKMQPKLLEVNWAPDCQRACQFYPDFFNEHFAAMFLDQAEQSQSFIPL